MKLWGYDYWPIFLVVEAVLFLFAFGIPELYAAVTNTANTLSNYSWNELHVGRAFGNIPTFAWYLSQISWLAFIVIFVPVITIHIWYRGI